MKKAFKDSSFIEISQYEHGGSRIFHNEPENRELIVDTYQDENFAKYILDCVKKYFNSKDEANAERERQHLAEVEAGIPFEFRKKPKQRG